MLPRLNTTQQDYLENFIVAYNKKTAQSKLAANCSRRLLADPRSAAGFKLTIKEMLYPIIGKTAAGSHFVDIDENEYIDISMGFGALLFGHMPTFLQDALKSQITSNIQLGPQAYLVEKTVQLLHELTHAEKVTFCNTGTEAVMTAIRLARLKSKRQKIVTFSGSYHGFYDASLGLPTTSPLSIAQPMVDGLPEAIFKDILILEYLSLDALEKLIPYANEVAAIIIEPVRGRFPDVYSAEYLHQLRKFATQYGITLIFDEVVTGFRCHAGGAQAYFNVNADLVIYGKALAGGLPVGLVTGNAELMAGIDGGDWQFGDNIYPKAATTFFAGTFNKNPLTVSAMYAVLQKIKSEPNLHTQLTDKTQFLADELNSFFNHESIPIRVTNFSSLFRFNIQQNADIFFYHLTFENIYVWEGRSFYLSTAHTNADINNIITAVKKCALTLQTYNLLGNQQITVK